MAARQVKKGLKTLWKRLKNKVMKAEVRCNQIYVEEYQNFCNNKSRIKIEKDVKSGVIVQGFGENVSSLVGNCLSGYDEKTRRFDEEVRIAKRELLTKEVLQVIEPTYQRLLESMRNTTIENFKQAIADELHKPSKEKKRLMEIAERQTQQFIKEMQNLFEDAAVKQAKWNHTTVEYGKLLQEMIAYVYEEINKKNKKIRRQKIAQRISTVASVVLGALGVAMDLVTCFQA